MSHKLISIPALLTGESYIFIMTVSITGGQFPFLTDHIKVYSPSVKLDILVLYKFVSYLWTIISQIFFLAWSGNDSYSLASKFNLTGFVKNLDNGDVYLEAQGSKENLEEFKSTDKEKEELDENMFNSVSSTSVVNHEKIMMTDIDYTDRLE